MAEDTNYERITIITECFYDFYRNTVKRHRVDIVDEITDKSYIIKNIGKTYKKENENKPIYTLSCIEGIKIFSTYTVSKELYYKTPSFLNNNLHAKIIELIKEELQNRLNYINIE